jgi:hypothetical protein|tara:strand:- start:4146 stop:4307 length:162 start_codon:yes stop_codon:yes gene_type:complete
MDSMTKDSIANIASTTGIGMTFMNFQTTISIIVLLTALVLNITRIYDWYKKSK